MTAEVALVASHVNGEVCRSICLGFVYDDVGHCAAGERTEHGIAAQICIARPLCTHLTGWVGEVCRTVSAECWQLGGGERIVAVALTAGDGVAGGERVGGVEVGRCPRLVVDHRHVVGSQRVGSLRTQIDDVGVDLRLCRCRLARIVVDNGVYQRQTDAGSTRLGTYCGTAQGGIVFQYTVLEGQLGVAVEQYATARGEYRSTCCVALRYCHAVKGDVAVLLHTHHVVQTVGEGGTGGVAGQFGTVFPRFAVGVRGTGVVVLCRVTAEYYDRYRGLLHEDARRLLVVVVHGLHRGEGTCAQTYFKCHF